MKLLTPNSLIFNAVNSLLGRFLVLVFLVVLLTGIFAWTTNSEISQSTKVMSNSLLERKSVTKIINDVNSSLWNVNTALQYLNLNSNNTNNNINQRMFLAIDDTNFKINQLLKMPFVISNDKINQQVQILKSDLKKLKVELIIIKNIRSNPLKIFPAMPLLVYKLNPISNQFNTTITIAIQESKKNLHLKQQREIHYLFSEIRNLWIKKINSFRMYASSKIGIFNVSVDNTVQSTVNDIAIFDQQIVKLFNRLQKIDNTNNLGFEQSQALPMLIRFNKNWHSEYIKVKEIYSSEDMWRLDTPLLKNKIYPLFDSLWQSLESLKTNIEIQTSKDIKISTKVTANSVSNSIWFLSSLTLLAGIIASLAFEFQIRRPINRVSAALKSEAEGANEIILPHYNLRETNDLVCAFSNMRTKVNARQERLQAILNNTAEGIITFDEDGFIETWNLAAEKLFDWREHEVIGTSLTQYISSNEFSGREKYLEYYFRNEIINHDNKDYDMIGTKKNSTTFLLSFKSSKMILDSKTKYTALVANITEQKALLKNLRHLAEHDGLTGLFNRDYFNNELNKIVDKVKRNTKFGCSILYIDLDNFKYVNDTLGHAAGDKILVDITQILKQRTRKSDLLARLGGDEFVVLLNEGDLNLVQKAAEDFREQIANYSLHYNGKVVDIGCSIGVANINSNTKSTSEAMSQADVACHFAKRAGRNRVHVFTSNDTSDVETMFSDMGWSRRIKLAIENDYFVLSLQPIVNTNTRELESYEVLIRMRDDNGDIIMPFAFLPTAERFGLAVDIDIWVIKNAIKYLSQIRQHYSDVRFSINLSAQSLTVPEIPNLIPSLLSEYNLNASAITFEVTETSAIAEMDTAVNLLTGLQKLGCKTSLDDFGSGMSSFAYLRELPVDIVKIDGSFVKNMISSPVDQAMLKAMNDIAHSLGKQTVAEFVEQDSHLKLLKLFGVDYAQGYYIDKPKLIYEIFPILDTKNCNINALNNNSIV